MATYLVVDHSSIRCRESAPPPYLRVLDSYLPLTTQTNAHNQKTIQGDNQSTYYIIEQDTTTYTVETTTEIAGYSGETTNSYLSEYQDSSSLMNMNYDMRLTSYTWKQYSSSRQIVRTSQWYVDYLASLPTTFEEASLLFDSLSSTYPPYGGKMISVTSKDSAVWFPSPDAFSIENTSATYYGLSRSESTSSSNTTSGRWNGVSSSGLTSMRSTTSFLTYDISVSQMTTVTSTTFQTSSDASCSVAYTDTITETLTKTGYVGTSTYTETRGESSSGWSGTTEYVTRDTIETETASTFQYYSSSVTGALAEVTYAFGHHGWQYQDGCSLSLNTITSNSAIITSKNKFQSAARVTIRVDDMYNITSRLSYTFIGTDAQGITAQFTTSTNSYAGSTATRSTSYSQTFYRYLGSLTSIYESQISETLTSSTSNETCSEYYSEGTVTTETMTSTYIDE